MIVSGGLFFATDYEEIGKLPAFHIEEEVDNAGNRTPAYHAQKKRTIYRPNNMVT